MLKTYFKTALRNIRKNRLYFLINVMGLTIGIAACLLIGIYISHELSYDKFNIKANRIVRVTMEYRESGTVNSTAATGTKVGPQFKRIFPEVDNYVRTAITHQIVKSGDKVFNETRVLYADPSFFKIFSFPIIKGNVQGVLDDPGKIVITASTAKKYFGTANPLHKILSVNGRDFNVSAVCEDVPQNSDIAFDFVTQFQNLGKLAQHETWWNANWITYLLLRDSKSMPRLQQQINAYMKTPAVRSEAEITGNDYLRYHLEPLTRVHLYSTLAGSQPKGSIKYVYMLLAIALLILIIACANYTNLATAQAVGRIEEIRVRKVMGASRRQVFLQFIGESTVMTATAGVLAFLLSLASIPWFNQITGKHFTTSALWQPGRVIALVALTIVVSFFASIYPAIILSKTKVTGVSKKRTSFTPKSHPLRSVLIVIQFAISVFLIIYTLVILQQMRFMQTKNVGYDKGHVLALPIGGEMLEHFQHLKDAFQLVPGVQSVTAAYDTPENVGWGDDVTAIDGKGTHEIAINALPVDLDFTETMKMKLLAGRDFQPSDFSLMDTTHQSENFHQAYIINEALAKKLGWTPEEAIGQTIERKVTGPIVGVVKNFNFSSLHHPIGPLLIFLSRDYDKYFLIRTAGDHIKATLADLKSVWMERVPDRPFSYEFLDDAYNKLYISEQRTSTLLGIAATLAILLACLGLFALAAFTTVQRTKEIGIRKLLGAGIGSITLLVSKNFLQLVGIAVLIAMPAAWWAGSKWLQDFAFRIPLRPDTFVLTAFITITIALLTIAYHTIKAATMNPVNSLRRE